MIMKRVNQFLIFSAQASKIRDGPMVIHRYNNEGGYLFTFMKEKKVYKLFFCFVQSTGSPYRLVKRRRTKNKISPVPVRNNIFLRCSAEYGGAKKTPAQYPSIISPVHAGKG